MAAPILLGARITRLMRVGSMPIRFAEAPRTVPAVAAVVTAVPARVSVAARPAVARGGGRKPKGGKI